MGSWPALLASGRPLQETLDNGSQDSGGAQVCGLYILFSYIYVRYISHISRLPLGIINRYAFFMGGSNA